MESATVNLIVKKQILPTCPYTFSYSGVGRCDLVICMFDYVFILKRENKVL